jgi:GR25 family glycosyltransferase involved in LPS biosynthesis
MIEAIYIVHYRKNTDRKKYLLQSDIFNKYNCIWNESYQTPESIPKELKYSIPSNVMCVGLAHIEILNDILEKKYTNFIIIEDDALINNIENICTFLEKCINEFALSEADIMFLSSCGDVKVDNPILDKLIYLNVPQKSAYTHCYTIKKDKIKQILDHIEYDWPIDWELSRLITKLNLKSCLTFPFIEQGSELHQYKSNLR